MNSIIEAQQELEYWKPKESILESLSRTVFMYNIMSYRLECLIQKGLKNLPNTEVLPKHILNNKEMGKWYKLKDIDPMPFGKFQGTAMANVPSWYLFKLYNDGEMAQGNVRDYILDNIETITKEANE